MKNIMTALLVITSLHAGAQSHCDTCNCRKKAQQNKSSYTARAHAVIDTTPPRHRPVIWYTPVAHSTIVDGIAIGIWAIPERKTLVVNGVNIEANPAALMLWAYMLVGDIFGPFSKDSTEDFALFAAKYQAYDTNTHATIRGLSVSSAQMGGKMRGVGINLVSGWANDMDGLEVSGLMNMHYRSRGVCISVRNKSTHCKGVQIGLFNDCKEGTLVQIGLLNKIGKRTVPLINCSLKRKNKKKQPAATVQATLPLDKPHGFAYAITTEQ